MIDKTAEEAVLDNEDEDDDAEDVFGESSLTPEETAKRAPGYTVTEINTYIKNILECHPQLGSLNVWGEISNWRPNKSGHIYFTLKDGGSVIKAVMWKAVAARLGFEPKEGMKVAVHASLELYLPQGSHQLICDSMHRLGVGELYEAFEALKKKLEAEGLFRPERKKKLPRFPKKIGVVTSPTGAAIRDMMNIFRRRSPSTELLIYPAAVQGNDAPPQIISGVKYFDSRNDVDLIIVSRGGGSIEDLWCFNDETLARVIADCKTPVISGVGHEIDFTIADFAADMRAPTPSAAAEIAVPDSNELKSALSSLRRRLDVGAERAVKARRDWLSQCSARRCFTSPESMIYDRVQLLDRSRDRLDRAISGLITSKKAARDSAAGRLDALSPLKILGRGYGLVSKNGSAVSSAADLSVGDVIDIRLADGRVTAGVSDIEVNTVNTVNTANTVNMANTTAESTEIKQDGMKDA